jgi:hypothetical protein
VHVFANAMWFNQYTQQFAYKNGQVPVRVCACVCVRVLFDLHESVYVCVCVCACVRVHVLGHVPIRVLPAPSSPCNCP